MKRTLLTLAFVGSAGAAMWFAVGAPPRHDVAAIEVWHGAEQRVGHLGDAQDDFNLMGVALGNDLELSVNGGAPRELTLGPAPGGFRRLGGAGHFNADVPIDSLQIGENVLKVTASGTKANAAATIRLVRASDGAQPLPLEIDWSALDSIQDAGQAVDGEWSLSPEGIVSAEPAYDRLFLIGNRTWRDYEVLTTVTVHGVSEETGPHSGAPGVGLIMRFAGHSVDPPRFPDAQPKWGYQPFGAILWLRFTELEGRYRGEPITEYYHGARNESTGGPGPVGFERDVPFSLRARCTTDPENPEVTRYSLKVWRASDPEPESWQIVEAQDAGGALRAGGVALVAHHANVTFGNLTARAVE